VEDRESPNSHVVVEVGLDEIPSSLGFNSQMPQVEDVELPNSHVVEVDLDDIPSTLGVDSVVHHSLIVEVSPFDVIFYLNEVVNCHTF
jgi:hypothetical protein